MSMDYNHLDITFTIDSAKFHVSSIMYGRTFHIVQSHSHGNGCYEIHYIPSGYGRAVIDGQLYNLSPKTLYVTGPHVEHSQVSDGENPTWEYCIYFYLPNCDDFQKNRASDIVSIFSKNRFWFGRDSQDIETTMKQLFSEFSHKQVGYQYQIELLL